MPDWLTPVAPLVGVILGYLGAVSQDTRRWRREWLVGQINSRREFYAVLIESIDAQYVLLSLAPEHPIAAERMASATETWRSAFARSRVLAPANVQRAITAYDKVRGRTVEAINARDGQYLNEMLSKLAESRTIVLNAINDDLDDINRALAPHVLSAWQRFRGERSPTTKNCKGRWSS